MFQSSPIHADLIPTLTIFFIFVSFQTNASNVLLIKMGLSFPQQFFQIKIFWYYLNQIQHSIQILLSIRHLNFTNFCYFPFTVKKSLKSHRLKIIVRHTILIPLEEQNNLSLFFPTENIQHPIAVISIITKQDSLSTPVIQLQHPVIVSCIQKLKHNRAIVTFL